MAVTPTKPKKTTTQVKTPTQYIPPFANWSAGRTGFAKGELEEIYAVTFGLTPEAIKKLEEETKTKATELLKPAPVTKPQVTPTITPTVAKELLIARTPYPKWWNDSLTARISLSAPGSQVLATVAGNLKLYVATIVITVTGETQITLSFGNYQSSGPLYLGGEGQPMGIVIAMGNSPAPCGQGSLVISATDPDGVLPSIGGFATCFVEQP
jgi:hypothetical protein